MDNSVPQSSLESLAAKLRAMRQEMSDSLSRESDAADIVELDQARVGRLTRMDAMAQREMALATQARMQTELRRVDAAIARIDNGTFGRCCRCREPIDINRLASDPAAPFCLDCTDEIAEEREDSRRGR
jgi:DnaK suppressor protein